MSIVYNSKPLRLDDTTVLQRMLSYNRVLLNLDVAKSSPRSLTVELEGDEIVEVQVQYENIPCSECLSAGHLSINCPFRVKPSLLTTPVQAALLNTPTTSAISGTVLEPEASAKGSQPPVAIPVSEVSGSLAFVLPASTAVPYSSGKTLHSSYPNCSPILPPSTNSAHSLGLNSANDLQHDSPITALPTDVVYEILEKNLSSYIRLFQPFSILEHCTFAEPTSFTFKSKNLITAQSYIEETILGPQALVITSVPSSKPDNLTSTFTEPGVPHQTSLSMLLLR
ncbi:hypothetical protein MRB53_017232 [Persea americana]|uniref:Uncharacterized protein n=1 Tax=Persea americana TaxID=3435 RepID=A0ACC2M4N3_PERAE|nr:hypothetical protein MRB53_017232 [Persea americana]